MMTLSSLGWNALIGSSKCNRSHAAIALLRDARIKALRLSDLSAGNGAGDLVRTGKQSSVEFMLVGILFLTSVKLETVGYLSLLFAREGKERGRGKRPA